MRDEWIEVAPPKKKSDWLGCKVKLTQHISNPFCVLQKGTIMTVIGHTPVGTSLEGDACDCCGVKPKITHVKQMYFTFVDKADK